MPETQDKQLFEQWTIIELFGHDRIAGMTSEITIAGEGFLRVDVPKTDECQPYTAILSTKAIYSITPVTQVTALAAAQQINKKPIYIYSALEEKQRQLMLPTKEHDWYDHKPRFEAVVNSDPITNEGEDE